MASFLRFFPPLLSSASFLRFLGLAASAAICSALTIAEINGNKFLSLYNGQTVSNVTGIITAKGPDAYGSARLPQTAILGHQNRFMYSDVHSVQEYRSNKDYLTEISSPQLEQKISSGNAVKPLIIGKDTNNPPTGQYSSLDSGDVFAVPNNISLVSVANPVPEAMKYGLDFGRASRASWPRSRSR